MGTRLLALGAAVFAATVAVSCGGSGSSQQASPSPTSGEATPAPTTVDSFVVYRDTYGDILAKDMQTGETYRRPTDPANEALLTAECTHDGTRIAYLRQDFRQVSRQIVIAGAGAPAEPVPVPAQAQGIAWSPDGTKIAYVDYKVDVGYRLAIIDLATGKEEEVVRGINFAGSPRWSPDGAKIAYHAQIGVQSQVMLYELGSGAVRPTQLTNGALGSFDPEWMTDSKTLIISAAAEDASVLQLYKLDINTKEQTAITDSGVYKRFPRLSPDGQLIGYTGSIIVPQVSANVSAAALHSFGIFLLNVDGSNERALTADPRLNPGPQDPYLDAFLLSWCVRGPWLDNTWQKEKTP